jgi:hypothetical protein
MDAIGWLIAGAGFTLALAALAARLYASAQTDLGFLAVSQDSQVQTILATKKGFFVVNKAQTHAAFIALSATGLKSNVTDLAPFGSDLLALDAAGTLSRCSTVGEFHCELIPLPVAGDLAKLSVSENGALVAITDNLGGTLHVLNAKTWSLVGSSQKKFGNPNRPVFTPDQLLLADNSGYAIQAWARDGDALRTPVMSEPHTLAHKTKNQPYFFEKTENGWLVLEAGTTLVNAELVRYDGAGNRNVIETGLTDAVSMFRTATGTRLLVGMHDRAVVDVDSFGRASPFGNAGVRDTFRTYWETQAVYKSVMSNALIAMLLFFLIPPIALTALGYNLGEKSVPVAKASQFQIAGMGATTIEFLPDEIRRSVGRETALFATGIGGFAIFASMIVKDFRIAALIFAAMIRPAILAIVKLRKIGTQAPTKFSFLPHHLAYFYEGKVRHVKYAEVNVHLARNRVAGLQLGAAEFERVPPMSLLFAANENERKFVALLRSKLSAAQVFASAEAYSKISGTDGVKNRVRTKLIYILVAMLLIALFVAAKQMKFF